MEHSGTTPRIQELGDTPPAMSAFKQILDRYFQAKTLVGDNAAASVEEAKLECQLGESFQDKAWTIDRLRCLIAESPPNLLDTRLSDLAVVIADFMKHGTPAQKCYGLTLIIDWYRRADITKINDLLIKNLAGLATATAKICNGSNGMLRNLGYEFLRKDLLPLSMTIGRNLNIPCGLFGVGTEHDPIPMSNWPRKKKAAISRLLQTRREAAFVILEALWEIDSLLPEVPAQLVDFHQKHQRSSDLNNQTRGSIESLPFGLLDFTPDTLCEDSIRAARLGEFLASKDSAPFLIHWGAFLSPAGLLKVLATRHFSEMEETLLYFGHIFFQNYAGLDLGVQPRQAYSQQIRDQIFQEIADFDSNAVRNFRPSSKVISQLASESHFHLERECWATVIQITEAAAKGDSELFLPLISHLTIFIRLRSYCPEIGVDSINIEEIPKKLTPPLGRLLAKEGFFDQHYDLIKAFIHVLPLDAFLVNEIRIKVHVLFRETAAQARFQDILRYIMHDSPSPYHLMIMRSFADYLQSARPQDRQNFLEIMEPFANIWDPDETSDPTADLMPVDYLDQLGESLPKVRQLAIEVRDLYEDLYGNQQARAIIRALIDQKFKKYIDSQGELKGQIIALLNSISRHQIVDDHIPNGLAKYFKTFEIGDFSFAQRKSLLQQVQEIRRGIQTFATSQRSEGPEKLYFTRLLNAIDPLAFSLICSVRNDDNYAVGADSLAILRDTLGCLQLDICWQSEVFFEINLIRRELESSAIEPLRAIGILERVERIVTSLAANVSQMYQAKAELLGKSLGCSSKVIGDFSAQLIRESILYPASLLVEKMLADHRKHLGQSPWHVTRPGRCSGVLVYFASTADLRHKEIPEDVILLVDKVCPDTVLPNVRGIISRSRESSLSHLAIIAGYRGIPWVSPDAEAFRNLVQTATSNSDNGLLLSATAGEVHCRTMSENSMPCIEKATEVAAAVQPIDVNLSGENLGEIIAKSDYRIETVGMKAWKLSQLSKIYSSSVPNHFTLGFRFFAKQIASSSTLSDLHNSVQSHGSAVEETLEALRTAIMTAPFDDQTSDAILAALEHDLPTATKLAVRSSTNVEDLDGYPGAGIYHSALGATRDSLFEAIRKVWASFYSSKAYHERRRMGFDERQCYPAVIVQELFEAPQQYGFVIHTVNPNNCHRDEAVIDIAQGLGEAVVGSETFFEGAPHRFIYNKRTGLLQRSCYASKSYRSVGHKNELVSYADDPFACEGLPFDDQLQKLLKSALTIESTTSVSDGHPQDIEGAFGLKDGQLNMVFVQTRRQIVSQTCMPHDGLVPVTKNPQRTPTPPSTTYDGHPILLPAGDHSIQKFQMPQSIFGADNANLITLWLEAFSEVLGKPGQVIIRPYGSLSYLEIDGQLCWDRIDDFDLIFYLSNVDTRASAWDFESKFSRTIKQAFIGKASHRGLRLEYPSPDRIALFGMINGVAKSWQMKDVNLKFLPIFNFFDGPIAKYDPSGYLPWSQVYSDNVGLSKLYRQAVAYRPLSKDRVVRNCEDQYALGFFRGREHSPFRRLKECKRLAKVLDIPSIENEANRLLRSTATIDPAEIERLWSKLPKPGSLKVQTRLLFCVDQTIDKTIDGRFDLGARLDRFRIVPDHEIYYSFGIPKDSNIVEVLACALVSRWLDDRKVFFLSRFERYRRSVTHKVAEVLASILGITLDLADSMTPGLIASVLLDFDHRLSEDNVKPWWFEQFAGLQGRSDDVSIMDIVVEFIKSGQGIDHQDLLLIDHIDPGCLALLPLMASIDSDDAQLVRFLHRAADLTEKPQVGTLVTQKRLTGEDRLPQIFCFAFARLIKPVRARKMSESEAISYMRGDAGTSGPILIQALNMAKSVLAGDTSALKSGCAALKGLKDQERRCRSNQATMYQLFADGLVACVHDRQGVQDTGLKYTFLPESARVLIQYSELWDSNQRVVGWRYHALGRSPLATDMSLAGLDRILNAIEESRHGSKRVQPYQRWTVKTHASAVCFGPVGSSINNVSLISPQDLAEICRKHIAPQLERIHL